MILVSLLSLVHLNLRLFIMIAQIVGITSPLSYLPHFLHPSLHWLPLVSTLVHHSPCLYKCIVDMWLVTNIWSLESSTRCVQKTISGVGWLYIPGSWVFLCAVTNHLCSFLSFMHQIAYSIVMWTTLCLCFFGFILSLLGFGITALSFSVYYMRLIWMWQVAMRFFCPPLLK